ncbi:hypothetical protein ABKN59_011006 [Abortiporus biennis]
MAIYNTTTKGQPLCATVERTQRRESSCRTWSTLGAQHHICHPGLNFANNGHTNTSQCPNHGLHPIVTPSLSECSCWSTELSFYNVSPKPTLKVWITQQQR